MNTHPSTSTRDEPRWFQPSVTAVRYLLGVSYLVNGLAWWVKMFPFPSVGDTVRGPMKHAIASAMIDSGWMYHFSKAVEVATGVALLTNQFVPLMLVVSMPVAIMTFLLDAFIVKDFVAWIAGRLPFPVFGAKFLDMLYFGGAVLAMQAYLMFSQLHRYRPFLARKSAAQMP